MTRSSNDYSSYNPTITERIICTAAGTVLGALTGFTFYENIVPAALTAIIGIFAANRVYVRFRIESRKKKLLLQFRDMLESLSVSIGAGSNIQNAFSAAGEDMEVRYGPESVIAQELRRINAGVSANINIEKLLHDFGERSGIEDIRSFSAVFETCYRLGGSIRDVVNMTCRVIRDKIDVRQEILTVVSAKKSEQNAMLVMPVIFTILLKSMGAGVADMTSANGIIATTIALMLFSAAYLISRRILRIEL